MREVLRPSKNVGNKECPALIYHTYVQLSTNKNKKPEFLSSGQVVVLYMVDDMDCIYNIIEEKSFVNTVRQKIRPRIGPGASVSRKDTGGCLSGDFTLPFQ